MEELANSGIENPGGKAVSGMLAGLSGWAMLTAAIFSGVGYFYFRAGRRDSDYFTLGTGVVLMAFPYFVSNALHQVLVGSAIIGFHYYQTHYGD